MSSVMSLEGFYGPGCVHFFAFIGAFMVNRI